MMSRRTCPAEGQAGAKVQRLESPGGTCEPRVVQRGGRGKGSQGIGWEEKPERKARRRGP